MGPHSSSIMYDSDKVERIQEGIGVPNVYLLSTEASHVDQVQFIRTTADDSSEDPISGGFRLKLEICRAGSSDGTTFLIDHV